MISSSSRRSRGFQKPFSPAAVKTTRLRAAGNRHSDARASNSPAPLRSSVDTAQIPIHRADGQPTDVSVGRGLMPSHCHGVRKVSQRGPIAWPSAPAPCRQQIPADLCIAGDWPTGRAPARRVPSGPTRLAWRDRAYVPHDAIAHHLTCRRVPALRCSQIRARRCLGNRVLLAARAATGETPQTQAVPPDMRGQISECAVQTLIRFDEAPVVGSR